MIKKIITTISWALCFAGIPHLDTWKQSLILGFLGGLAGLAFACKHEEEVKP